jgi:hypothetical protein
MSRIPLINKFHFLMLAAFMICSGFVHAINKSQGTIQFDCRDNSDCPAISIAGDPVYVLPNGKPGPFRGLADPSMRKDPDSNRIWMSYSYTGIHAEPGSQPGKPIITPYVSIHLAHSDDNGRHWRFDKNLWESTEGKDQGYTKAVGYSIHEVSTISPFVRSNKTTWFGLHLRYFLRKGDPIDKRLPASFHHRLTMVKTPLDIGKRKEARLTNPLTAPGWGSNVNLSRLDPALKHCTLWSEPALFQDKQKLYLIVECLRLDLSKRPPVRVYDQEFNGVFVARPGKDVTRLRWRWLGKITDHKVAQELNSKILTQVDIARARDGSLLLIVTPTNSTGGKVIAHKGCRVLEIESLDPPKLARHRDGSLKVRAAITSSDAESAGLCTYDPASETGVVLVRTRIDLKAPLLFWQMHATGVHP